jgi:hypothetical protein
VIRTSNQYCFVDPQPPARPPDSSKFEFQTGTKGQASKKEKNESGDAPGGAIGGASIGQGVLFDNYEAAYAHSRRLQRR